MRDHLIQLLFSERGLPVAGCFALALIILVAFFRQRSWAAALWVLLIVASGYFCTGIVRAAIAGSDALLIVPALAPFALVFVACSIVRPRREAFSQGTVVYAVVFSIVIAGVLALPRPGAYHVHVLVVGSDNLPVANASVSWTAFRGLGPNFDGRGQTDSSGSFTFTTYWPEEGDFVIQTPAAEARYRYEHWPDFMAGGRSLGIRFIAEGDKKRIENNQYVVGRVIAANSTEVLEVHLTKLWKLEGAEPMFFWNKLKKLSVDGEKVWFDTKTGTLARVAMWLSARYEGRPTNRASLIGRSRSKQRLEEALPCATRH